MIGLLYESGEWSDYKLAAELCEAGCDVRLVDMAHASSAEVAAAVRSCSLLVSRVFASAVFRGHQAAHARMDEAIALAAAEGIPLVNPPQAHGYEVDKRRTVEALGAEGLDVPRVQACGLPGELDAEAFAYPCVIKPNCGGRTTHTLLARTVEEARSFLAAAPELAFIVEDYIVPERGFITRIELVDGSCALIVKRSVVAGGLSAYHLGSTYELYPECAAEVRAAAEKAGRVLGIEFGSFDVIESGGRAFVIDANAVSNVSPDNTETFGGLDLMRAYAQAIARRGK